MQRLRQWVSYLQRNSSGWTRTSDLLNVWLTPGMVTIKLESELASFKEDLNQVSSVSLLMTSSPALANVGLFELTRRPSLTRAVSSSFAETTEEPGRRQVNCQNFVWICFDFSSFT